MIFCDSDFNSQLLEYTYTQKVHKEMFYIHLIIKVNRYLLSRQQYRCENNLDPGVNGVGREEVSAAAVRRI